MKIKVLGTRGEIKPTARYHAKRSGILIDQQILFDIGEEEFLTQEPSCIFITHLHPDHAFFVRSPEKQTANITVPIYSPESYNKNVVVKKLIKTKKIDNYVIKPIPTHHSLKVASQAYLIKKDNDKILYTGDMVWIDKKYHHEFADLDLVITEASYFRKGGLILKDKETSKLYGHTGVPNLINLFSKFTKHILFVHFGSWFYEDIIDAKKKLIKLGKENGVSVLIGYDGMELDTKHL